MLPLEMRQNNFDFLRFVAASTVIFSHAFALASGSAYGEMLSGATNGRTNFGSLAVLVFFATSGYLVSGSLERNPDLLVFLRARALRIFPALAAVLLLSTFVLGPLVTADPSYWSRFETYNYLRNISLYQVQDRLPGVFQDVPFGPSVNGPIWTLPSELICYLMLAAISWLKLANGRVYLLILLAISVQLLAMGFTPRSIPLLWAASFATGAALYAFQDRVVWKRQFALLAILGVGVAVFTPWFEVIAPPLAAYAAVTFGRGNRFAKFGRQGDLSYGLYLWGWPVAQTLLHFLPGLSGWALAILGYSITLIVAWLSWTLIEQPFLRLKHRRPVRRQAML